jgi:hypothetical protein
MYGTRSGLVGTFAESHGSSSAEGNIAIEQRGSENAHGVERFVR